MTDTSDLIARAEKFAAEHIAPNVVAWTHSRRMAYDALKTAARLGFNAVEVPKAKGGLEVGFRVKRRILEIFSRHSFDFAFSWVNTANIASRVSTDATPAQQQRFLPALLSGDRIGATALSEPGAGSDFAAIKTLAVKDGDGWRIDGEKGWITNAAAADIFLTYVQTDPNAGWRGVAGVLIDGTRKGFVRNPPEALGGGMIIGAGGFKLDAYRAHADEMLSPPGAAFKRAMNGVNSARTYVAAMCCAMVDACLDTVIAYAKERKAFGSPLASKQGLRWMIADIATDLEAARLLTDKATDLMEKNEDATIAAAHAKKFAARMAVARISDAMQIMGAAGLREDYPFLRHLASARVANYTDGSTEMQQERIAAILIDKR